MAIDINTSIYSGSGTVKTAKDSGQTTRHYASDGSSPTHDWEVTGYSGKNYEASCVQNIPGDELSIKMWGPGHKLVTLTLLGGKMGPAVGTYSKSTMAARRDWDTKAGKAVKTLTRLQPSIA